MARAQEERELRLARLRQKNQRGLDSGPAEKVDDLASFMDERFDEAIDAAEECA